MLVILEQFCAEKGMLYLYRMTTNPKMKYKGREFKQLEETLSTGELMEGSIYQEVLEISIIKDLKTSHTINS
jgi:hypothetical protein